MQTSEARVDDDLRLEAGTPARAVDLRWVRVDALIVGVAMIATVLVHPWHLILSRPYWIDEAWVADLTRVPLSRLIGLSSSTPFGFALLLRVVPGSGLQRGRLLVLLFSMLSVAMAYVLARSAGWRTTPRARVAGTLAAAAVMLAPFSLGRNDLKQYTCDAFCALVVLTLAMWIDRSHGRVPPWALTIAAIVLLPLSTTSSFVTVAAFAGLLGSALGSRSRDRTIRVLVAGGVTAVAYGAFFGAIVLPNTNAALRSYWNAYYLDHGPRHMWNEAWSRLSHLHASLGMPAIAFVIAFLVGVAVLVRLGSRAIAIAVPVLWIEMVVLGRLRRYPFLDLRTSHFLLVTSIIVGAIGAAGVVQSAYSWKRIAGIVIGAFLAVGLFAGVHTELRELHIPYEDVRSQTQYVVRNRTPKDVILVNEHGAYGFSYYWPHGTILTPANDTAAGFGAQVKGLPAVWTPDRTDAAILAALRDAVGRWRSAPAGSRLFIVRSHVNPREETSWQRAFTTLGVHPRRVPTGKEAVLVLGPA